MPQQRSNHKVAILVEKGFEEVELIEPRKALEQAGAKVEIISPVQGKVNPHFSPFGRTVADRLGPRVKQ